MPQGTEKVIKNKVLILIAILIAFCYFLHNSYNIIKYLHMFFEVRILEHKIIEKAF